MKWEKCQKYLPHARTVLVGLALCMQVSAMKCAAEQSKAIGIQDNKVREVKVVDYLNREVSLPQPAKRIVALAPHIVENLFSAGAGDSIVGVVDYSDHPPEANKIHRVGGIGSFSIEAVVSRKPDLVIVWVSGKGVEFLRALEKLGITSYASDPSKLEDVARSIKDFGILSGNGETASIAANEFEVRLNALRKKYGHLQRVSAFYQVWNDPLQTLNNKSIISDVLDLCGADNAFGDAISVAPKVSIESIISRDPQAIIASGMGEARPDWLDDWKRWDNLQAVRYGNLFYVHPDLIQRHTVRILQGAERICEQMQEVRDRQSKALSASP